MVFIVPCDVPRHWAKTPRWARWDCLYVDQLQELGLPAQPSRWMWSGPGSPEAEAASGDRFLGLEDE